MFKDRFSPSQAPLDHRSGVVSLRVCVACASASLAALVAAGCSTSSPGPASCNPAGKATPGPADTHCSLPDGGMTVQPTSAASCMFIPTDAGDDGGGDDGGSAESCSYGPTMFGSESDDDDCKYHVVWTTLSPICEGSGGVNFEVKVTHKTDGSPLTGAGTAAEVFTTSPGDWDAADFCDTMSTHISTPGPGTGYWPLNEGPPGTYTGPIAFDKPGQWTVRFHFYHECFDTLPDSQHGHAAYHITVP